LSGTVIVNFGFRMENFGIRRSSNTWPTLNVFSASVITQPPFISDPVPAIVRMQPTGRIFCPSGGFCCFSQNVSQ